MRYNNPSKSKLLSALSFSIFALSPALCHAHLGEGDDVEQQMQQLVLAPRQSQASIHDAEFQRLFFTEWHKMCLEGKAKEAAKYAKGVEEALYANLNSSTCLENKHHARVKVKWWQRQGKMQEGEKITVEYLTPSYASLADAEKEIAEYVAGLNKSCGDQVRYYENQTEELKIKESIQNKILQFDDVNGFGILSTIEFPIINVFIDKANEKLKEGFKNEIDQKKLKIIIQ